MAAVRPAGPEPMTMTSYGGMGPRHNRAALFSPCLPALQDRNDHSGRPRPNCTTNHYRPRAFLDPEGIPLSRARRRFSPIAALLVLVLALLAGGALTASAKSLESPEPSAFTLELRTFPVDLVLQVNGTQVLAPYLLVCDAGNYSTIGAPSPQLSGPTRYRFASWSDGGSGSHIVTCSANGNLTAFFSTEYQITLDSVPAARSVWLDNISYTTPATAWCPQGAARIVNVFPQEEAGRRFTFANWSDGGAQNHTLACDGPRTLSAIFTVADLVGLFSSPIRAVILVDGTAHFAPDAFWCREGSAHVLEAPSPQVDNASRSQYRFTGWADGAPPVRTIMCARPTNFTAFFEAISPPPPELPPAPGPGY